jgi:hypothetical protein
MLAGTGLVWPILDLGGAGGVGIQGSGNTFADIQRSYAGSTSLSMPASGITYVDDFTYEGLSAGARSTLTSTNISTISKSSGIIDVDYLAINNSTATGGATWYAGANSLNNGSNTGWIFTAAPSNSGNMLMLFS